MISRTRREIFLLVGPTAQIQKSCSDAPEPPDWIARRDAAWTSCAAHLLRQRRVVTALDATHVEVDGRRYVNFASNNYLGLTHHPEVMAAACEAVAQYGAGSGARGARHRLQPGPRIGRAALAEWKGTEAAVLLPSGTRRTSRPCRRWSRDACAGAGVRFLLDKLCHASLIDAVRDAGRPFRVFPHNHLAKLAGCSRSAEAGQMQVVVTESIFSMDGDAADLRGLAALKREHPFVLLLDEAHGSGVYGPDGTATRPSAGCRRRWTSRRHALQGARRARAARCARRDVLRRGRELRPGVHLLDAVPPAIAAAAEAAISVVRSEPHRRRRLRDLARRVRASFAGRGSRRPSADSPIIPIILGPKKPRSRPPSGCGRRPVRPRDPPADRPARHEPAAGDALLRAHRRRGGPAAADTSVILHGSLEPDRRTRTAPSLPAL